MPQKKTAIAPCFMRHILNCSEYAKLSNPDKVMPLHIRLIVP